MTVAHRQIRVLICNRQTLFRDGLKALFENRHPIEVVGEAATAGRTIHEVQHLRPDVVLMDPDLPDDSSFEVLRRIRTIDPRIRILVLSLSANRSQVRRCLQAGAVCQVGPKAIASQLQAAILHAVGPDQSTRPSSGRRSLAAVKSRSVAVYKARSKQQS